MSEKHDKQKIKKEKEKEELNEDENSLNELNINEEYAERFQHNEKRKKEEKLRNKYGVVNIKNNEEEYSGEESPEESEDSEGELDNEIVRDKFINTLLELKDENETKKLIGNKAPIFTDDDFKKKREKIHKNDSKENEKIQYGIKDALLDNKSSEDENSENNIYSVNYKPKKIEEDQTEKKAFISAVNEELQDNSENSENNDFFDNGLLIKKKTPNNDLLNNISDNNENNEENEKEETPEQAEEKVAGMTLSDALKKSKIKPENVNMSLLEQIWGESLFYCFDMLYMKFYQKKGSMSI